MPWTLDGEYQKGVEKIKIENVKSAIKIIVSPRHPSLQKIDLVK